jgi:hypothetical protein
VFALVADSDSDTGKLQKRTLPPSLLTATSPGNWHDWFFLREALSHADAKQIGEGIRAMGGDADTGNPAQPYRIAGTPNYPNLAKQKRGRFDVCPTRVLECSGKRYSGAQLREVFPIKEKAPHTNGQDNGEGIGDWCEAAKSLPDDLKELIKNGLPNGGDRSAQFHSVVGQLKRLGWSAGNILALLKKYPNGIAQKYAGNDRLHDEVERSFGKCDGPPPTGNLPPLIISSSNPTASARELARLIAEGDDFLFNGNAPIYVATEAGSMPRALMVKAETVRVLAHKICVPTKTQFSKNGATKVPIALSEDIARLYLYGLEGSWGLKPFRGITTAPILGSDGSIRIANGYDRASGNWCHNIPVVDVPERPDRLDALDALERIRQRFKTFPFADAKREIDAELGVEVVDLTKPAGLDESSFHVALMTGVCRQSLELAPAFICDAPSFSGAGTGKGMLVKAICVTSSGVRPAAFTSGHDATELDKRLSAALVEAHPSVFLDNFNAKELTSDILASVLTENPAMVRVMGRTKNVPLNCRTFIGITGNGVEIAEDMARRLIKCRLDAKMENPEERKFQPGFLDAIFGARPQLLADVLTIWRWGRQNEMKAGRPLGSFEVWCRWCRDPLITLGMRDPIDRIAEIKANDPKRKALVAVFDTWFAAHRDNYVKAADLGQTVLEVIDSRSTRKADGSLQFSRQRVASFLARVTDTHVGGYVLTRAMLGPPSKEVANYKLARTGKTEED